MVARRWTIVCAAMLLAGAQLFPAWTQARGSNDGLGQAPAQAPATDNSVPADLRPLLAAPQSEMRLVSQRYAADRSTLNGNYDGGRGPGRGGRGGGGGGGPEGRGGRGMDPGGTAVVPLVAVAESHRAPEALRHELADGARQARRGQAFDVREGRARDVEDHHSDESERARCRHSQSGAVDAARPLRVRRSSN